MKYNIDLHRRHSFHGLELKELYRVLSQFFPEANIKELLVRDFTGGMFVDEICDFLDYDYTKDELQDLKIMYYLASGCGINRIIRLLNTSQSRVYRVKKVLESPEAVKAHPLSYTFSMEPMLIPRMQDYINLLNILDGFRFLDPTQANNYLQGQVRGK